VPINLLNPRPGTKFGDREFMDPWDGVEYHGCSFEDDELELTLDGERSSSTKMTIRRGVA